MTAAVATGNGQRPHVDLDAILGDRAAVRDVTLGGTTYQLRPLNLVATQLLEDEKIAEAFRYLVMGTDAEVDAFLEALPAVSLVETITAIYGAVSVGEAVPPSPGSQSKATTGGSGRSKRTSSRKGSR